MEFNLRVGCRIRQRRWIIGWTQERLASSIGVSHRTINKYETGAIDISVRRLWDIAAALQVPVASFFDDQEEAGMTIPEIFMAWSRPNPD